MKIFQTRPMDGYQWLLPVQEADSEKLVFDGNPRRDVWQPVRMRLLKTSEDGIREESDFPTCSAALLPSSSAVAVLAGLLEGEAEILPLIEDGGGEYFALNVTRILDALDEQQSQFLRMQSTGKILRVERPVFIAAAVEKATIFKVRQAPRGATYVTETFVDAVRKNGLRGLDFVQVWAPN